MWAVPWRQNQDDPKMDGERLKSEVIVMDKEYKEKLKTEEHVPVPKRVYISRENLEEFGFTERCPGCMSFASGNCETSTYRKLSKANRGGGERKEQNGRKADQEEEGRQQREQRESTARMEQDAPTSSSRGSGDVTPTQSSSSSGSTTKMSGHEGGDGCKETTKKMKTEEEHPEDPERDDGKWMRTDGNKRKAAEESEESRLRKTVRYLKELDKMENKEESGKTQEVVEVAEVEVNEEEEEWTTEEESRRGDEGGDLDPEQVLQGREEDMKVHDQDVEDV